MVTLTSLSLAASSIILNSRWAKIQEPLNLTTAPPTQQNETHGNEPYVIGVNLRKQTKPNLNNY